MLTLTPPDHCLVIPSAHDDSSCENLGKEMDHAGCIFCPRNGYAVLKSLIANGDNFHSGAFSLDCENTSQVVASFNMHRPSYIRTTLLNLICPRCVAYPTFIDPMYKSHDVIFMQFGDIIKFGYDSIKYTISDSLFY